MTEDQYRIVKTFLDMGFNNDRLAKRFNLSKSTVKNVLLSGDYAGFRNRQKQPINSIGDMLAML